MRPGTRAVRRRVDRLGCDRLRWLALALVAPIAALVAALPVLAQTAPAVAPNPNPSAELALRILRLQRVQFVGGPVVDEALLQDVARPFLARTLRYDDLEELRQQLIQALVQRGYISSGAAMERYDADSGTLQVRIVEGRVAALRVQGAGGLSERYVAQRLVRDGEVFNVQLLEDRFRALLVDPLFSRLDVRVLPGDALGQTVLAVDATRARSWDIGVFANNHQAPSVGADAVGVDLTVRNLSGWGDTLAGSVSRNRGGVNGDAGWTLPLLAGRTLLGARLTQSHSSVVEEPLAQLDVASVVRGREVSLSHPLRDEAAVRWLVGALQSERRNRTTLGGEPFSFVAGDDSGQTQVRSTRLYTEWTQRSGSEVHLLRATWSRGRNSLPDPAVLPEQPPRRFQVWLLQGQTAWQLGEGGSQVVGRLAVQHTRDRLLPLEQFALGGRQTVRGYRENQLVRDQGWNASVEWRTPLPWGPTAQRPTVALFADAGAAANVGGPTSNLVSVGVGLGWSAAGFDIDLQWGHALRDAPGGTHDTLQDHGLHVSLRWRLP